MPATTSNPSISTAATTAVSAVVATEAKPAAQTQSQSEQDRAAAAFLAEGTAPVVVKAQTQEETPAETAATETTTTEQEETAAPETTETTTAKVIEEPAADAGPEWLENVRAKIAETGEIPDWFFERAKQPLLKEAEKNAKIRELEANLADLKAATEAKPTVIVDTPENVFAKLPPSDLAYNETYYTNQRAWAMRNLTTGGKAGDTDYTPEQTADLLLQAESSLELIKSAKTVAESRQKHFEEVAKVAYPDLAKPGSELRKQVDAIKATHPGYAKYATSDTDLADMIEGRKLREEKAKGIQRIPLTAKPQVQAKATTTTTRAGASTVTTVPKVPITPTNAAPDIATLRKQALQGDEKAANKLAAAFLQPAAA